MLTTSEVYTCCFLTTNANIPQSCAVAEAHDAQILCRETPRRLWRVPSLHPPNQTHFVETVIAPSIIDMQLAACKGAAGCESTVIARVCKTSGCAGQLSNAWRPAAEERWVRLGAERAVTRGSHHAVSQTQYVWLLSPIVRYLVLLQRHFAWQLRLKVQWQGPKSNGNH
jgi:hypothetical protein